MGGAWPDTPLPSWFRFSRILAGPALPVRAGTCTYRSAPHWKKPHPTEPIPGRPGRIRDVRRALPGIGINRSVPTGDLLSWLSKTRPRPPIRLAPR